MTNDGARAVVQVFVSDMASRIPEVNQWKDKHPQDVVDWWNSNIDKQEDIIDQ